MLKIAYHAAEIDDIGRVVFATDEDENNYFVKFIRDDFRMVGAALLILDIFRTKKDIFGRSHRPKGEFVDIGANVGTFTIPIAKYGVRTLSIEANPVNYTLLTQGLVKSKIDNVSPIHCAAANEPGVLTFQGGSAWGHVTRSGESSEGSTTVSALRVADVMAIHNFHNVKVIKIDVEGYEKQVLEGIGDALRARSLQHVIVESHIHACVEGGYPARDLINLLKSYDFSCYMLWHDKLINLEGAVQTILVADILATRAPRLEVANFTIEALTDAHYRDMARHSYTSSNHEDHAFLLALERVDARLPTIPDVAEWLASLKERYGDRLDALVDKYEFGLR